MSRFQESENLKNNPIEQRHQLQMLSSRRTSHIGEIDQNHEISEEVMSQASPTWISNKQIPQVSKV